jgi:hypothetical protein
MLESDLSTEISIPLTYSKRSFLKKLLVALWNKRLYVFMTEFLCLLRHDRWIIITFLVSYSKEI